MLDGRFRLGVGSGEALNEHVVGAPWPGVDERLDRLEEAIEILRRLWTGEFVTHRGRHFTVDHARIYTLPQQPPPIFVSAFGPKALDLAARVGDGYIGTMPDPGLVAEFKRRTSGKPALGGAKVAYADTEDEGVEIAHRLWANSGLPGELSQVLPSPRHFEQASHLVTPERTRDAAVCGPDAKRHIDPARTYVEAGYDELYIANMGPNYRDTIALWRDEVLPELRAR